MSWPQALPMDGAIGLTWGLQSPRRSWDRPELSEAPHHPDRTNSMPTAYSAMAFASSRGHRGTTLPRGTLVVRSRRLRWRQRPRLSDHRSDRRGSNRRNGAASPGVAGHANGDRCDLYSRDEMEGPGHLRGTMLYHVLREGRVLHDAA
jgi:hypothetical protein